MIKNSQKQSHQLHLFHEESLPLKSLHISTKNFFSKIEKIEHLKEFTLNEDLKAIFVISDDFFFKNRMQVREILVSLTHFSIILVYDNKNLKKIEKEKENFFNAYLSQDNFSFLLNKTIITEYLKITSDLKKEKELKEIEYFKNEILDIGTKIGNERDTNKLLNKILYQSMKLVRSDAGSIAVLGLDKDLKRTDKNILTFYASKNISKEINFNRFSLKVSSQSLAGYVVISGETLKIDDAYKINEQEVNYSFNKGFDKETKFRTKSILVVPMINHKDEMMGVIQLINKKKNFNQIINYEKAEDINSITTFNKKDVANLKSLSSFLTVSLENAILYNEIDNLFNSFVQASVSAVEQRDPVTSGHSFRVAKYSTNLAEACTNAGGVLEDYRFNSQQIREIRYASLLHDFGKIGVREDVLVKSKKLNDLEIKDIFNRINLHAYNLKLLAEKEKMKLVIEAKLNSNELAKKIKEIDQITKEKISALENKKNIINQANAPSFLEEDVSKMLEQLKLEKIITESVETNILTDQEFNFLSIKRGNLSTKERKEIESHVTHTFNFLNKIPWTKDLELVPEIAYGHHEKLDGSGYPLNKTEKDILPQTKIMTVCDIFDALTAADRPYKKSLSYNQAIEILYLEANDNKLDKNLVDYFIKSKSYKLDKNY